jgi:outer membrane protein
MIIYSAKEKILRIHEYIIHLWRNNIFTFLFVVYVFFFFLSLETTIASQVQSMSLAQALGLALKNNHDIKLAKMNCQYSKLSLKKEKNDYLPQLTATSDLKMNNDYGQSNPDKNYYFLGSNISATLNLFKGFDDIASIKNAQHILSSCQYTQIRQVQQVTYDIVIAYLKVMKQLREIEVAKDNMTYNCQQEKMIKAFCEAGKVPATDFYQQQAETANAKAILIFAENLYKLRKLELLEIIGIKDFKEFEVVMPEIAIFSMPVETDINRLIKAALKNRADILALSENIYAKEAKINETASGRYVSVDLNAGIGSFYDDRHDENFMDQLGRNNLYSYIGLSLSLPIFDRNLTRIKVNQAQINKKNSELRLEKARQKIRVEISQAVADYQSAHETVKVSKVRLLYTEKALESVYHRYKRGAANLTELTQIRSDKIEAKNNLIEAEIDKLLKIVSIFFYSGDLKLTHLLPKE